MIAEPIQSKPSSKQSMRDVKIDILIDKPNIDFYPLLLSFIKELGLNILEILLNSHLLFSIILWSITSMQTPMFKSISPSFHVLHVNALYSVESSDKLIQVKQSRTWKYTEAHNNSFCLASIFNFHIMK